MLIRSVCGSLNPLCNNTIPAY